MRKIRFARGRSGIRNVDDDAVSAGADDMKAIHVPKKRKQESATAIPKKKKKA
jgi:hypothetical protein